MQVSTALDSLIFEDNINFNADLLHDDVSQLQVISTMNGGAPIDSGHSLGYKQDLPCHAAMTR